MDDQTVSVEYVTTREEFMTFARWQIWTMKGLRLNAVITALAVVGGITLIVSGTNTSIGVLLLAMCALEIGLGVWIAMSATRRAWAKRSAAIAATYLQFSEAGVHVRTSEIDAFTDWSTYLRTVEYRDLYLMEINKLVYRVIPRRAFDSPTDEQEFRRLVSAHTAAALTAQ